MSKKNIVVVESPSKTKKIASFLGKDYTVISSVGHIRDLPKSKIGVDTENNYEPQYEISKEKADVVKELKKYAKDADAIYLATDEDREGEAIAWHVGFLMNKEAPLQDADAEDNYQIANKIKTKNGEPIKVYRVVFNSITKDAVLNGFENPRKLDEDLIDAQQARRVLDRLVGYKLSPVLWEKIRYGLSAGRVQSVAVRFVVEREREIENFEKTPYFEIFGDFEADKEKMESKLIKLNDQNVYIKKTFNLFAGDYSTSITSIDNKKDADKYVEDINSKKYKVESIETKELKRHPTAPFTTSTLQQSASTNLGYVPRRTMQIAQKLYENGLITYMRTDSVNIAEPEVKNIRNNIKKEYGEKYLSNVARHYKSKKQANTQEAHEAIRPTDIKVKASDLPKKITPQWQKLYDLIWKRTMASQMSSAVYENTKALIGNTEGENKYVFEVKGSVVLFDGFTKALDIKREDQLLPAMKKDQIVDLVNTNLIENEMSAPPRYNESSLVKVLESFGIGRPSTYASIISTIQSRGYVSKVERNLVPTDNGFVVNDMLVNHFPMVVDVDFTANMEDELDKIAEGKADWRNVIGEFYPEFGELVDTKRKELKKEDFVNLGETDEKCPECGEGHLIIKLGRYGKFYSCSNYPECKYAKPMENSNNGVGGDEEETEKLEELIKDRKCPEDGGKLVIKTGRFGNFIACENYPKCKFTEAVQNKIGVKCPNCGDTEGGEVVTKRTKKGRTFYGCSRYPKCDFASWTKPDENTKPTNTEESEDEPKKESKKKSKK